MLETIQKKANVSDYFDHIVSNFVYCQNRDFVDQIVSNFIVYFKTPDFVDNTLTLVSLWTKHINRGIICLHLLFQHYFIDRFSNLHVG